MALSGEQKKVQALFSELRADDEQAAPHFATIWNRGELSPRRPRRFKLAFVGATALLVCTVVLLFAWSRYSQPTKPHSVAKLETSGNEPSNLNPVSTATIASEPGVTFAPLKQRALSRMKASARRNRAQLATTRKLTRDVKAITEWESPTSALLSSLSDELFTSLPQLNQGVRDLKSFLPSRPN